MSKQIIGRKKEIAILKRIIKSNRPEFLAIYGRRRVGKTYLITNFFESMSNVIFFNSTGSKIGDTQDQIKHFTQSINDAFFQSNVVKPEKNWDETFLTLTNTFKSVASNKKIVLFLDELPWMATQNSKLLQCLDYYWNHYWSHENRIKLIICGSSASWIINKVINDRGGLHNRITKNIQLAPFDLNETKAFLKAYGTNLNQSQVTQIYMVTGGIPYYLAEIEPGRSATQAIGQLAFQKNSFLLKEFDKLFSSLFSDPAPYIELLRIIANYHYGLPQQDIIRASKLSSEGGRTTERLDKLKEAGFILSFTPYQSKIRGTYYRVIDEYTLFYFRWIEPVRKKLVTSSLDKGYWQSLKSTPAWHSWAGYAFEAICYMHILQIRRALNIPPSALAYVWRYVPKAGSIEDGAQIDLLFDRLDDSVTICEIKFSSRAFVLNKQAAKNLVNKGKVFTQQTRNRKQQFFALITANGMKDTIHSDDLIVNTATLDDLFTDE